MTEPVHMTNEELREAFRIAKSQASLSRFHRERFAELQFEFNRRNLTL